MMVHAVSLSREQSMKTDTRLVPIGADDPVYVRAVVGEGQPGGTSILWDGGIVPLPDPPADPRGTCIAARGADAHYKVLQCATNVKDVSTEHNRTSVTYVVTTDDARTFPYAQEVPQQGDWAQYAISFVFVPR
jgi:hypothetical protein